MKTADKISVVIAVLTFISMLIACGAASVAVKANRITCEENLTKEIKELNNATDVAVQDTLACSLAVTNAGKCWVANHQATKTINEISFFLENRASERKCRNSLSKVESWKNNLQTLKQLSFDGSTPDELRLTAEGYNETIEPDYLSKVKNDCCSSWF